MPLVEVMKLKCFLFSFNSINRTEQLLGLYCLLLSYMSDCPLSDTCLISFAKLVELLIFCKRAPALTLFKAPTPLPGLPPF